MKEKPDTVTRTMPLPVFFPRGDGCKGVCDCAKCTESYALRREVMNVIKTYRDACRRGAGVLFLSEAASAKIEVDDGDIRIKPNTDGAKVLLEATFGKTGKAYGYAMRDWLKAQLGGLRGDCADSARMDIVKAWQSKDAEFPKASRGWLCLNFARRVASFNGIGLPVRANAIRAGEHSIEMSLQTGDWHEAKFGKLDGSRWRTWKKIVSGEWPMCDPIRLRWDSAGGLVFDVAYKRPSERNDALAPDRVLECAFTDTREAFAAFKVRSGHETLTDDLRRESLNALGAIDLVDHLSLQTEAILGKLSACGSRGERRRGCGNRKGHEVLSARSERVSVRRLRGCRGWNHTWASRVLRVAESWRCGRVMVFDLPDDLFGRSWQWSDFKQKLGYRAKERGIEVEYVKSPKLEA